MLSAELLDKIKSLEGSTGSRIASLDLNPTANEDVVRLKIQIAELANTIDDNLKQGCDARLCHISLTNLELVSMTAVKAIFSKPKS